MYMYVYTHNYVGINAYKYIYFPFVCSLSLVAASTQHPDAGFEIPFSIKKNQDSLKKHLIPGLGQRKYKMNLEHLFELCQLQKPVRRSSIDQICNNLNIKIKNESKGI